MPFAIHSGQDPSYIGIQAILSLVCAIIFHTTFRRLPVPFTVLVFGLGMFLGELVEWTDDSLGALGDSIQNWRNLHPNTFLAIFLPPLIFESSSSIDFHIFRKAFYQILVLAIPGVLINAFLISFVAKEFLPYGWNFTTSLTFGAILCATDPVAVVSILKDLGTPLSLASIIQGESLLNDGVAFVIFLFMADLMGGGTGDTVDFIGDFFYASGVGTTVGIASGYITTFVSSALFDDYLSQIMLTIVSAFGTWFVADGILQASGVLAVAALGLYYAAFRHGGLSTKSNEALEHIWQAMSFVSNTLVFVRSGIVITSNFRNIGESIDSKITSKEWGYLIMLYILLNLIRTFSVILLYPVLKVFGYGFNMRWAAVVSWSGLRGAVSLSLSLFLFKDRRIPKEVSTKILFFVSGIVCLTLLINAVTARPLVRLLSLNRQSKAAQTFYFRAIKLISTHVDDAITLLQRSSRYKGADWTRVWSYLPGLSSEMQQTVERQIGHSLPKHTMRNVEEAMTETNTTYELIVDETCDEMLKDARIRFLNLVKSSYHRDFRVGAVTSKSFMRVLIDSATAAQETAEKPLGDWDELFSHCRIPGWYNRLKLGWIRHMLVIHRLSISYQLASAFVTAHQSVVPLYKILVPSELTYNKIINESKIQVTGAMKLLNDLEVNFPDITRTIKTRQVTELVLNDLSSFAEELLENGEIEEKELISINNGIHRSRASMWLLGFHAIDAADREIIFRNSELFIGMSLEAIDTFLSLAEERIFDSDDIIQEAGEDVKGIYILAHGSVEINYGDKTKRLSYGDIINSLVAVTKTSACFKCVAKSDVRAYFLKMEDIRALMEKHKHGLFERNLYFRAGFEASIFQYDKSVKILSVNPMNTATVMSKSSVVYAKNNELSMPRGGIGILFAGEIIEIGKEKCLPPKKPIFSFVYDLPIVFQRNAIYLWIPPEVEWMLESYHTITPSLLSQNTLQHMRYTRDNLHMHKSHSSQEISEGKNSQRMESSRKAHSDCSVASDDNNVAVM